MKKKQENKIKKTVKELESLEKQLRDKSSKMLAVIDARSEKWRNSDKGIEYWRIACILTYQADEIKIVVSRLSSIPSRYK